MQRGLTPLTSSLWFLYFFNTLPMFFHTYLIQSMLFFSCKEKIRGAAVKQYASEAGRAFIMKKESNEYGSGKLFEMEDDLKNLCRVIRNYVSEHKWEECDRLIPKYMELYPDSAVPHNLRGIVMEKQGRHAEAMKHFRAAQAFGRILCTCKL